MYLYFWKSEFTAYTNSPWIEKVILVQPTKQTESASCLPKLFIHSKHTSTEVTNGILDQHHEEKERKDKHKIGFSIYLYALVHRVVHHQTKANRIGPMFTKFLLVNKELKIYS